MTDESARTPHQRALERAVQILGSQEQLSIETGIGRSLISEVLSGKHPMKAWMAGMIEYATNGRIKRAHAMPELFGPLPKRLEMIDAHAGRDVLLAALRPPSMRAADGVGGPSHTCDLLVRLIELRNGPVGLPPPGKRARSKAAA